MPDMATTHPTPEQGNWFLRGVQSAIFYYISLTPCLKWNHKRQRRREARGHPEIITTQPGMIRQPRAFETNEQWAEELMLGPGPPKGWKVDTLLKKLHKTMKSEARSEQGPTSNEAELPTQKTARRPSTSNSDMSKETSEDDSSVAGDSKPTMERRLSNAVENIKDSLRATLHPERWNWIRYDREDEILWGFSERMTRMWNRATSGGHHDPEVGMNTSSHVGSRAGPRSGDPYDYHRARNPEINEFHPPVVSQLPATKDEAAWMMLPPPSAEVMAGKQRPGADMGMRWPICVMGRPDPHHFKPSRATTRPNSLNKRGNLMDNHEDMTHHGPLQRSYEDDLDDPEETEDEEGDDDHGAESVKSSDQSLDEGTAGHYRHHSEPITKPPPIHARPPLTDDIFPAKRDSWQFHYYIPPSPAVS